MALPLQCKLHSFISPNNRKLLVQPYIAIFTHSLDRNSFKPKGTLGLFSLNFDAAQTMKSHFRISALNPPQPVLILL